MDGKFLLFDCCKIVKGSQRAIIIDTQRMKFELIPISLYNILIEFNGKTVKEVKSHVGVEYNDIIEEYLQFLIKHEFVFFTENIKNYPKSSSHLFKPAKIDNSIIDIGDKTSISIFGEIINQLLSLNCRHVQIRCFFSKELEYLRKLLTILSNSFISSVEVLWHLKEADSDLNMEELMRVFPIVTRGYFFNHKKNRQIEIIYSTKQKSYLVESSNFLKDKNCCGVISIRFFSLHIDTFLESQHHNTCLNRKISIDQDGNIKNCPSMTKSYGNIKDTTLEEALNHPDFKQYWNIKKDQISVCQDCEFRHICTDCRAYIENPEDIYSKPLKCGYNPYTCEWEDWSTNPLKEKAIKYYGMNSEF